MKGHRILTLLLVFITISGWAQKNTPKETIWNHVMTGYANTPLVDVTRVALHGDRTEMTLHINFMKGQWIRVAPSTILKANGKEYAVREATVLTLGEQYILPEDTLDFMLTFDAVPTTTKTLDLIEPGGWQVLNIRSAGLLPDGITNTYWRNEATGDWLIGFTPNHLILDNHVWDITSQKGKKDEYKMTISDGRTITVDKMRNGLRTITIGSGKPFTCSPITTAALPDYPVKDLRTGFVDNGYNPTDSVTIIGWLKDMPEQAWQQSKEFQVSFENIISNKEENAYAKMDSLGRFSFKMSLLNSSEVFIDWGRTNVNAFLEPGKTYFFLHDFTTGQKLWMGDDVRVQNEILSNPRSRSEAKVPYDRNDVDLMAYKAQTDSARRGQMEHLNALKQSKPTLSQRYIDYMTDYYRMIEGRNLMQARYNAKDRIVPKEYMDYVCHNFWRQAPKPYTLYRDFITMNNDFLSQTMTNQGNMNVMEIFKRNKDIVYTEEERKALEDYPQAVKQVQADFEKAKMPEERQRIVEAFNNTEMVSTLNALIERNKSILDVFSFSHVLDVADSLGCDKTLHDLILAQRIYQQIDGMRQPVDSSVMSFAEKEMQLPAAFNTIKDFNNKYLAIQQRDISKSPSLKSADDVANMSEGEQILRKIIEPYKGRLILLDIWGTWCSPCKDALSHSEEEYERLKEFDLVYLYLANRSSDEAWKNVIKQYNILGDNVVHYNLPADQQSAVEHFININGYPTYKLIDRDGNILDVNADPRNLERLASLLKQLQP